MKCLAAVCAVLLIVAVGCGDENRSTSTPFEPRAGDIKLPALPARGLVINRGSGVELVGLNLRYYGALSGLHLSYSGFARSVPLDPNRPSLAGKAKGYIFDAANGYLLRTRRDRSDLGYGFEYRDV